MSLDDLASVVSTACAPYEGAGIPAEDLHQEGWLVALRAAKDYDPKRHHCEKNAYLVTRIRSRLSRLCARARTRPHSWGIPPHALSRELSPPEQAIFNERTGSEGL